MTRHVKLLARLLSGTADQAFAFADLCAVLRRLGFDERQRGGSHHIFSRDGVPEILNLQPQGGGQAKAYQVRQARDLIFRYELAGLPADAPERDDEA